MKNREQRIERGEQAAGEQGFMLLALIVTIAIILIGLSVAASKVAFSLRREREVESARRADQYVRAIRRFYLKNKTYPSSIKQLENTNMVRYLRQQYVDPLTGKADYRLIPVGQNKTQVKGFFGEPLSGISGPGLGAAAGMQSSGFGGTTTPQGSGTGGGTGGTNGTGGGIGSQSATSFSGGSGPFMGVGSSATGTSIVQPNEQTAYEDWEFLYDPRIEQLKVAAALNGGPGSVSASDLDKTDKTSKTNP